jgi:hypothetical protein
MVANDSKFVETSLSARLLLGTNIPRLPFWDWYAIPWTVNGNRSALYKEAQLADYGWFYLSFALKVFHSKRCHYS